MPRIACIVVPGMPHHVTQRGNRREDVFFEEGDRRRYLVMLEDYASRYGLEIWAYSSDDESRAFCGRPCRRAIAGPELPRHAPGVRVMAESAIGRKRTPVAGPLLL